MLQVIRHKSGSLMVDSREVATMVEKPHDQLMRSIRTYIEYLESAKMQSQNFFIESTYLSAQNKEQPCYLISKKGCDMVANKMTGEKGVLFTATYVTKFEEMENEQNKISAPQSVEDLIILQATSMKEIRLAQQQQAAAITEHEFKLADIDQKVTHQITLTTAEQKRVQGAVNSRVRELGNKDYYRGLYGALKKQFNVPSYRDLKRSDLTKAFTFIQSWSPGRSYR